MFRTIMAVVVIVRIRNQRGERLSCASSLELHGLLPVSLNTPSTFSNCFVVNGDFLKNKYICYNRKFIDSCKNYKRNSCPPVVYILLICFIIVCMVCVCVCIIFSLTTLRVSGKYALLPLNTSCMFPKIKCILTYNHIIKIKKFNINTMLLPNSQAIFKFYRL